jgi:hypothetical protein
MREWVKEKLSIVDELYPADRIDASKRRWQWIWNGGSKIDRMPFVYSPATVNYYDDNHTPEERLRVLLDEFIARGRMNDDFIPSFFPGCKQSTIPNMFGAQEVVHGKDYTVDRLIQNIEDIDQLTAASIRKGSIAHSWLEMQQYLVDETEGRVPVHVTDMQGPADVCGQLLGYEDFFMSAYTHPELFHKLMEAVTNAFIMFWQKQKDLLGDLFIGTHLFGWDWVPDNCGASLSADSLVMISPAYYEEFYKPYLVRVGEAFGGLSVHSCGDFSGVMKNLCATPFLKAVNAGQMTVRDMLKAGMSNEFVIIARAVPDEIPALSELARKSNLKLDLSIAIWPSDNPLSMSSKEWDDLIKIENRIFDLMSF